MLKSATIEAKTGMKDRCIKVLLIEDDLIDSKAFYRMIRKEGLNYEVDSVLNLFDAEKMLRCKSYHIVVSDNKLPDGTIANLTNLLNELEVPFVVTTGAGDEMTAVSLMKQGASDYLVKDISNEYLIRLPYVIYNTLIAHEAKQNKQRIAATFHSFFSQSGDAQLIIHGNEITSCNLSAVRLLGYENQEEVTERKIFAFFASTQEKNIPVIEYISEIFKSITTSGSAHSEAILVRKSGENFFSDIVFTAIRLDDKDVIHTVVRDISDRKCAEAKVLLSINELELKNHELDRLSDELLSINRDLEKHVQKKTEDLIRLVRMKNELITRIGHDLKTPLTPILALVHQLKKDPNDPDAIAMLSIIQENAINIKKKLDKIFELAKLDPVVNDNDLQWVFLDNIISYAISCNSKRIYEKGITFETNIPNGVSLLIHPSHANLILDNLLNNAVKFSEAGGHIVITAEIIDEEVCITVTDYGGGIAPEDISHLFEEFYCGDKSRHDRNSHGIGLTIVKRLVEIYHGSIDVQSEGLGKGAKFSVGFGDFMHRNDSTTREK